MNRLFCISIFWICLSAASIVVAFQGGKRNPVPPSESSTSPSTRAPRRRTIVAKRRIPGNPKDGDDASKFSRIALKVTPGDSVVWLGDQQMPGLSSDGSLSLTNIKPGSYILTIRRDGYRELLRQIELKPGENEPVSITLEPLRGTLSVRPNVDGSSIGLRSIDRDLRMGEYAGAIEQVDFPPGEYEVTISKPGYQPTSRRFTLKPGGAVELEPRIDALPMPTPTPQLVVAARSSVSIDGKYLVVRVLGTSGDSARTNGTINVTVNTATPMAYVQGSLNGLPCDVSLVSLENVAEGSLINSPAPSNGWALIGARLRPIDSKRPISFAINWVAVGTSNALGPAPQSKTDVTIKAVPIHRVVPKVPLLARSSGTKGVVKVTVVVSEDGNVKSAKAFDGPMMLRQAAEDAARDWKFKPAKHNGIPIQSTETIYFTFEGY